MVYSSPVKSFEETYKSSYSHGLESIYALENVDIKSIRPLQQTLTVPQALPKESVKIALPQQSNQLSFDLGKGFRGWIPSFQLKEPIHLLSISPQAEKILVSRQISLLEDLLKMEPSTLFSMKGLGQGHIDEIQGILRQYVDATALYHAQSLDFSALLRAFLGSWDKKKNALFLESFNLVGLLPLTGAEMVEIRHLPANKRDEWAQETLLEYASPERAAFLKESLEQIAQEFIIPWIRSRQGLSTRNEIEEHLKNRSDEPEITSKVLAFLSCYSLEGQFAFKKQLPQVEQDLYCSDASIISAYRLVIQKAHSYFYKSELSYSLPMLIQLIEREFATEWISFAEGFVEKALRYSPAFRIRKTAPAALSIKLA